MTSTSLAAERVACPEPASSASAPEKNSYSQILKSTALVGGSSVVNVAAGIIRTKAMALFLGPSGVGLMGLYSSIADLTQAIAGFGVQTSGVRQMAEALGSGDEVHVARTASVLRRLSLALGVLGGAALLVLAGPVSGLTFGSKQNTIGVMLLSIVVCLRLVSAGQGALIQGMRRISDLAAMGVIGAILGTIASIVLVYVLGANGVVPSLIAVAGITLITSWWYSRRLAAQSPEVPFPEFRQEASALLKLGIALMVSNLVMMASAYAVRIILRHQIGFEATGLYQSAWTLGGLYVGFILQAMAADFYPRLTATADDNVVTNRLVNEQTRVGLLLAGPGALATLTFAPIVIAALYTGRFAGAVPVLRWIVLGAALRVITWPAGFIILAKAKQRLLVVTELSWAAVNLGLTWLCVARFGVSGAGIAFFGSYVFHGILIYAVGNHLSGFGWTADNKRLALAFMLVIGIVFCSFSVLPGTAAVILGAVAVTLSSLFSVRAISRLVLAGGDLTRNRSWYGRMMMR